MKLLKASNIYFILSEKIRRRDKWLKLRAGTNPMKDLEVKFTHKVRVNYNKQNLLVNGNLYFTSKCNSKKTRTPHRIGY